MHTTKFYRIPELCEITGLSESGLYKLIRENRFPKGVKLTSRATGWPNDLVEEWVAERLKQSTKQTVADGKRRAKRDDPQIQTEVVWERS